MGGRWRRRGGRGGGGRGGGGEEGKSFGERFLLIFFHFFEGWEEGRVHVWGWGERGK